MADTTGTGTMVTVTIDGVEIQAGPEELVIEVAERHGVYIPRFCYHPRMTPVGMCRMCLVEIDSGRGPTLSPSCMVPVSEGMTVDTTSEKTKKAQDGVLEFLLINHPLDCPVCDKGGECPLQDQTMAFGPGESRFVELKRHFEKPIPISDTVYLDRERCILCDRCTRFADEVAGDPLIRFTERGNETQIMTFPDEPFSSYFSGNTVQICPVGALTAKPYRFKARPWDLEQSDSTCTSCALGCRVSVQTSRNEVVRIQGVDTEAVSHGWLCDKGRFDFEAIGSDNRLGTPFVRDPADESQLIQASWGEALDLATAMISDSLSSGGPASVGVIGGARLTNEDAYAWSKLTRSVIGTDNVDAQLDDGLDPLTLLGLPRATIADACAPGAKVLLLGVDVKEELPVLFLRLRGAVTSGNTTLIELSPSRTGLSDHAKVSLRPRPGELTDAVASILAGGEFDAAGLKGPELARAANAIGDGPLVVVLGRANLAESSGPELESATLLAHRPDTTFLPALRRSNVMGALEMGLSPGLLPGRVTLEGGREWFGSHWGPLPEKPGMSTREILEAAAAGRIGALVLLGADPLADFRDHDLARRAFAGAGSIISLDAFPTESTRRADVVLPIAMYSEADGTTTNIEGRVSTLAQRVTPPGTARRDWMVAAGLARRLGSDLGFGTLADISDELEAVVPTAAGLAAALSAAGGEGAVLPTGAPGGAPGPLSAVIPEPVETAGVDAYSFRLIANRRMYDQGTLLASSPSISGLAKSAVVALNPADLDRLGTTDGGRVNVISARTSVVASVKSDPGVARGTAVMAVNQPGGSVGELIEASARVNDLRIENL